MSQIYYALRVTFGFAIERTLSLHSNLMKSVVIPFLLNLIKQKTSQVVDRCATQKKPNTATLKFSKKT